MSWHIEAIHYEFGSSNDPKPEIVKNRHFNNPGFARTMAKLMCFEEAQELNEACREENGAEACWFDVSDDNDDTSSYDFVVRCWDGNDYRYVCKYKVVKDSSSVHAPYCPSTMPKYQVIRINCEKGYDWAENHNMDFYREEETFERLALAKEKAANTAHSEALWREVAGREKNGRFLRSEFFASKLDENDPTGMTYVVYRVYGKDEDNIVSKYKVVEER